MYFLLLKKLNFIKASKNLYQCVSSWEELCYCKENIQEKSKTNLNKNRIKKDDILQACQTGRNIHINKKRNK